MRCKEEDKEIEAYRCKLDPSYHSTYSYSRKPTHCDIIRRILSRVDLKGEARRVRTIPKKLLFATGPIGAGKSFLLEWMILHDYLPTTTNQFLQVNMDEIRDMLPESKFYKAHLAEQFGEMTQREAGTIAELLVYVALGRGMDVIVDSAMIDLQWQEIYINKLKAEYEDIHIGIFHITAEKEIIDKRIRQRKTQSDRFVPMEIVNKYYEQVSEFL
jgi:ribose 1,5-bisphosphokinase PhnN